MTDTARPEFPSHLLPPDLTADELAMVKEQWTEAIERVEARGPVSFDFRNTAGYVNVSDIAAGGGTQTAPTAAPFDVPAYHELTFGQVFFPDPADLAANPIKHIEFLEIAGTDQPGPVLDALAAAGVSSIALKAVVDDDAAAELRSLWDFSQLDDHTPTDEERDFAEARLAEIRTGGSRVTDADLAALDRMGDLSEELNSGTSISDDGFAKLAEKTRKSVVLAIESDAFTGSRLDALEGAELVVLRLSGDQLTGRALNSLPLLPSVQVVGLRGPKILDGLDPAVLAERLPALEEIDIQTDDEDLPTETLVRLARAFPGRAVNGQELSERAVAKLAAKYGIALD